MKRVFVGFASAVLVCGGLGRSRWGYCPGGCRLRACRVRRRCVLRAKSVVPRGDSLFHLTRNHVYDPVTWDMNVCHTHYHVAPDQANQGQGIYEGPKPPPPIGPPQPMPPAFVGPNECLPWCA